MARRDASCVVFGEVSSRRRRRAVAFEAAGVLIAVSVFCGPVLTGCDAPGREPNFASHDPAERALAAVAAASDGDLSATPDLVAMLDAEDPAARLVAIGALERITGETFGYDYAESRRGRAAAVQRWEDWVARRGLAEPVPPIEGAP